MSKERDLLPWVLGALCATAVAVAITAVSSNRREPPTTPARMTARSTPPPSSQVLASSPATPSPATSSPAPSLPAVPSPRADDAAAAAPVPEPAAQQPAVSAQAASEAAAPSGQIWECSTKGVKTFSNNPCGDKSTLLEVAAINTMNAAPAVHYTRTYAREPAYAESDGSDQEPYSDEASAETAGNSYTIIRGVGFLPRRRPEHSHHRPMPNHRNSAPMPRKF